MSFVIILIIIDIVFAIETSRKEKGLVFGNSIELNVSILETLASYLSLQIYLDIIYCAILFQTE